MCWIVGKGHATAFETIQFYVTKTHWECGPREASKLKRQPRPEPTHSHLKISFETVWSDVEVLICPPETGFTIEDASQISLTPLRLIHRSSTSQWCDQRNHSHFKFPVICLLKFLIRTMRVCRARFQGRFLVVGDSFKAEIHIFPCIMFPITDVWWLCCHMYRGSKRAAHAKKQIFYI